MAPPPSPLCARQGAQPSALQMRAPRHFSNIPIVVWRPEADASTENNVMRRGSALAVLVTVLRGVRCQYFCVLVLFDLMDLMDFVLLDGACIVPCTYASPSSMCQPCGNNLSRAYCYRPYFVGWSQASPHTPTDLHVCQTCQRPLQSALLHPCAAQHTPAPTLTACLGHCADSGPKVSYSFCLAGRSTVQCGGLHLSWVMQNSHCQPKKKLRRGSAMWVLVVH